MGATDALGAELDGAAIEVAGATVEAEPLTVGDGDGPEGEAEGAEADEEDDAALGGVAGVGPWARATDAARGKATAKPAAIADHLLLTAKAYPELLRSSKPSLAEAINFAPFSFGFRLQAPGFRSASGSRLRASGPRAINGFELQAPGSDPRAINFAAGPFPDTVRALERGYGLQAAGCRLQAAGYRLQATGYRLQATG